jgi:drug/metabolite transporter (DMT)-like permease
LLALIGFAGNSLLCRAALGAGAIDAASFTTIRIASGALVLGLLARATAKQKPGGTWRGALALIAYAVCFSFAYLRLNTGPGALILFCAVQLTMLGLGIRAGERPRVTEWLGLGLALAGLAILTLPGASAPDPIGAILMGAAGVAWGLYTILGRASREPPLVANAGNFLRGVPFALAISAIAFSRLHTTPKGALLAIASGALASGAGYSIWYAALRGLTATRAAIVQLSVPVVAAVGGVLILDELVQGRLLGGGATILAGLALALLTKRKPPAAPPAPADTPARAS